ncbi:hypothetical protein ACFVZH_39855 [Streptomyces sp. NPDC059534]|uniref:hypothetical protein n=1 Tax=Streptomyces sp. NPDC059534 TaxID=3346859 RepID=UPI0036738331
MTVSFSRYAKAVAIAAIPFLLAPGIASAGEPSDTTVVGMPYQVDPERRAAPTVKCPMTFPYVKEVTVSAIKQGLTPTAPVAARFAGSSAYIEQVTFDVQNSYKLSDPIHPSVTFYLGATCSKVNPGVPPKKTRNVTDEQNFNPGELKYMSAMCPASFPSLQNINAGGHQSFMIWESFSTSANGASGWVRNTSTVPNTHALTAECR